MKTPIKDGFLQSDIDFTDHKPIDADLSEYAGENVTWNETTGAFDAATGTGTPGGENGQIQYKSSVDFLGIPSLSYDGVIPATATLTGLNATKTGILLQNTTVTTSDIDGGARAPAIIFKQHYHYSGADHVIEHKIEAKDTVLTFQGRTDGGAWSPSIAIQPSGSVTEYSGDISIIVADLSGLDTVATGGDPTHPQRVAMFNNSTTSVPGISMKNNGYLGWAATGETYQAWVALNDTVIDRPAAGVVRLQSALELTPVAMASLPAASLGRMAVVNNGASGLAWGATLTGGGGGDTTKYLVWYNGTNWTVAGK